MTVVALNAMRHSANSGSRKLMAPSKSLSAIACATDCVCARQYTVREKSTHQADSLHERLARDVVLLHADDGRRRVWSRGEDRLDRVDALQRGLASQLSRSPLTHEDPIVGARSAAALGVSERGDARVEAETLGQDVLDLRRGDGLEVLVDGALGDDDDGLALADLAVLQRSIQPAMP